MSGESNKHRKAAADHLRASRKTTSKGDKERETYLAAGYKELARNEEWSAGEKERSKKRPAKPNKKDV